MHFAFKMFRKFNLESILRFDFKDVGVKAESYRLTTTHVSVTNLFLSNFMDDNPP